MDALLAISSTVGVISAMRASMRADVVEVVAA